MLFLLCCSCVNPKLLSDEISLRASFAPLFRFRSFMTEILHQFCSDLKTLSPDVSTNFFCFIILAHLSTESRFPGASKNVESWQRLFDIRNDYGSEADLSISNVSFSRAAHPWLFRKQQCFPKILVKKRPADPLRRSIVAHFTYLAGPSPISLHVHEPNLSFIYKIKIQFTVSVHTTHKS